GANDARARGGGATGIGAINDDHLTARAREGGGRAGPQNSCSDPDDLHCPSTLPLGGTPPTPMRQAVLGRPRSRLSRMALARPNPTTPAARAVARLASLILWLALLVEGVDAFLAILGANGAVVGFDFEGIAGRAIEIDGPVEGLLGLAHRNRCMARDP